MASRTRTVRCTLPPYQKNRQRWRKLILQAARSAADAARADYGHTPPLDVSLLIYMTGRKRLLIHDVDNRLKDVLDALHGRFRAKAKTKALRLFENDNCVYRVVVEKRALPKKYKNRLDSAPGGHLSIRAYKRQAWRH
jgi:Holliday junction resolvase RusA-like endonuclease